jgi:hypothetical protein
MGSQLIQSVSFTNVAPAGQATLPHNINANGLALVPDFVAVTNGAFEVITVTDSAVTVQNNGVAAGDCYVWLEFKHTIQRAFDAVGVPSLTPNPFIVGSQDGSAAFVTNTLTVGMGGNVQYTSIKDACDAAIAGGASPANPYQIIIYAGVYVEDPFTMTAGMYVSSAVSTSNGVEIQAADPTQDLITMNGGILTGVRIGGVTTAGKACIRCSNPFALSLISWVNFINCAIGVEVDSGATCAGSNAYASIDAPGQAITEAVLSSSGAGSALLLNGALFGAPLGLLPFYATNPIQCCVRVINGARADIGNTGYLVAPLDNTQVNVYADDGSQLFLYSAAFSLGWTAVRIGAGGANTYCSIQGGAFSNHVVNFQVDSATGEMFVQTAADNGTVVRVPGATFTGTLQNQGDATTELRGDVVYEFPSEVQADLGTFIHTNANSGVITGGAVVDGGGLTVDVDAGEGWSRLAPDEAQNYSWIAVAGLVLDANATNYVYIDATTMVPTAAIVPPPDSAITLAIVITDGANVLFTHEGRNLVTYPFQRLFDYLINTRRITIKTGIVTSAGTGPLQIDITGGVYYRAAVEITFAAVADATFTYFYNNGNTLIGAQTDLDNTQYDNAGVLTAMTPGWFRADTVYVTSDGQVSIVYGTAEYATQAQAEAAGVAAAPADIAESACRSSLVVVEEGGAIVSFTDVRPNRDTAVTAAAGAPVTDHGSLLGLADDDHPQYLLANGTRAMSGALNMGAQQITNVGNVDGVDVSAHATRHQPGGIDAIPTAVVVSVGQANAEGVAASLARADHVHLGSLVQSQQTVTADTSTASAAYVDLLTANINTGASFLLINFTAGCSLTTGGQTRQVSFQILVDGVAQVATAAIVTGGLTASAAVQWRVAVAAGAHVVKVQWKVSGNTAQIQPTTRDEHANLRVSEVLY